eukprot:6063471-Amphidinium_carterae.1
MTVLTENGSFLWIGCGFVSKAAPLVRELAATASGGTPVTPAKKLKVCRSLDDLLGGALRRLMSETYS